MGGRAPWWVPTLGLESLQWTVREANLSDLPSVWTTLPEMPAYFTRSIAFVAVVDMSDKMKSDYPRPSKVSRPEKDSYVGVSCINAEGRGFR